MWGKGGGEAGYLASGINCPVHIRQGPAWGGQGSFPEEVAAGGWLLKSRGECGNSLGQRQWPLGAAQLVGPFSDSGRVSMGLHILGTLHQLSPSEDGLLQKVPCLGELRVRCEPLERFIGGTKCVTGGQTATRTWPVGTPVLSVREGTDPYAKTPGRDTFPGPESCKAAGRWGPGHGALRTGIRSRDIQLAPTCPPAPRPHPHMLGAEALPYPSQRPLASELHPALASDWLLSERGEVGKRACPWAPYPSPSPVP